MLPETSSIVSTSLRLAEGKRDWLYLLWDTALDGLSPVVVATERTDGQVPFYDVARERSRLANSSGADCSSARRFAATKSAIVP